MVSPETLNTVDAIFERFDAQASVPGIAYGVVFEGVLIHARGLGTLRVGTESPPDHDSVFRIASMTKSFTAAAILLLRDAGRLRLDDAVGAWVPELSDLAPLTSDAPPITIGHLLTMSAGLPTDDPWGDRQQGLERDRFDAFLRQGPSLAWTPGTRFEYSNLGYAILGRVVTNAAGIDYADFVRQRLLEPLGMTATTFLADDVPAERLAHGYLRRDEDWLDEPSDGYGAFAPMGGVLTSVRDLTRWVAEFTDAFPPRDDADDDHPLRRATRREMQQAHRSLEPELTWATADGAPTLTSDGYGYGLFVRDDLRSGRIVGHSGGYPGFGANMRWHPASGIGIVAFGNARYARVGIPLFESLFELIAREGEHVRRVAPWPATTAARATIEQLLERWDDDLAGGLFAMNVGLDEPLALRRAAFERLRETHGALVADDAAAECLTPASLAWWMNGERGRVKVEILLDPERPPRVQDLTTTSVPGPTAALTAIAERLAALLAEPGPAWPADVSLVADADRDAIERGLRAAEARFGPVVLGQPIAGDGSVKTTWRLSGARGDVELRLELETPDGPVKAVSFVPPAAGPPVHAV